MQHSTLRLNDLFNKIEQSETVLPNFQRGYVWDEAKQRRLLASCLLGLPMGSVLLLEGKSNDYAARALCSHALVQPKNDCKYLLDGQQRISSLKSIFSDLLGGPADNWRDNWDNTFRALRVRWGLKVQHTNGALDFFNLADLNFNPEKVAKLEPSQLEEIIEAQKILIKDEKLYFHPAFHPKSSDGSAINNRKRRNEIAREYAIKGVIPLFEIFQSGKPNQGLPMHHLVLNNIADIRKNELKNEFSGKKKELKKLLQDVAPDIEDYLKEDSQDKINDAWSALSAKWVREIISFFKEMIEETKVPSIILPSDEISRAFAIFEVINQGGTPLNEYDLIVAKAARHDSKKNLSEVITAQLDSEVTIHNELTKHMRGPIPSNFTPSALKILDDKEPTRLFKNLFLNMLSILSHTKYGELDANGTLPIKVEHLKREKILQVSPKKINENTKAAVTTLVRALLFLMLRCGLKSLGECNYQLMILPIAYALKDDDIWKSEVCLDRIEYWYWVSQFSGRYLFDQNNKAKEDISHLYAWLKGHDNPFTEREKNVLANDQYANKDILLLNDKETLPSRAIHSAILQYILSNNPRDFLDTEVYLSAWVVAAGLDVEFNQGIKRRLAVEDHHIYPLANATNIGESTKQLRRDKENILNSPLNRTYISDYSNGAISGRPAQSYFDFVNDAAQFNHCLPSQLKETYGPNDEETDKDYYLRVLSDRFYKLKEKIMEELINLRR